MTSTYAANILSTLSDATHDEINEGIHWYSDQNIIAYDIADGDVWRGAGVMAAYSPQNKWPRNLAMAIETFRTGVAYGHTTAMVSQAQRIVDGEFALDVLNGPKVRAFCSAIADPDTSSIATIDRHAYNIAMGTNEGSPKIGARIFRTLSDAYVEASVIAGYSVAQIQAITWVTFRNRKGII
jgi:hypothetical protein